MAIYSGFSHYKWPFSIAMLNCQRVIILIYTLWLDWFVGENLQETIDFPIKYMGLSEVDFNP